MREKVVTKVVQILLVDISVLCAVRRNVCRCATRCVSARTNIILNNAIKKITIIFHLIIGE